MGLDKPVTGPGFFGWPIKAQARRPLSPLVLNRFRLVPTVAQIGSTVVVLLLGPHHTPATGTILALQRSARISQ
jgi:hypothetical protein